MPLAHLRDGADREVASLLRIVPVREQHVRQADWVAVDRQPARETGFNGQWKPGGREMAPGGAIEGVAPVDTADDDADVVAVHQQLSRLLDGAAVRPRH